MASVDETDGKTFTLSGTLVFKASGVEDALALLAHYWLGLLVGASDDYMPQPGTDYTLSSDDPDGGSVRLLLKEGEPPCS